MPLNTFINACRFASTAGMAVLLVSTPAPIAISDPAQFALWGIMVTSTAGIVLQILRSTADAKRDERRHRFEIEDRKEAARERSDIVRALELNAQLVKTGSAIAEAAFEAANDVNGKIERIAAAALTSTTKED